MDIACCSCSRGSSLRPSPTHHHPVDALSTLRELRRSISRSPSKRHCPSRSATASPRSPLSPAHTQRSSPLNLAMLIADYSDENTHPGARKPRPLLRRAGAPLRFSVSASTPSSRGPIRRALSDTSDDGNGSPRHAPTASFTPKVSPPLSHTPTGTPTLGYFTTGEARRDAAKTLDFSVAKSSPLKRSDGIMNLEQAVLQSPANKRRSLQGGFYERTSSSSSLIDIDDDMDNNDDNDDDDDSDDWENETPTQEHPFRSPLAARLSPTRRPASPSRPFLRSHGTRTRRSLESNIESPSLQRAPSKSKPRTSLDSHVSTRLFDNQRSSMPRILATPSLTIRTSGTRNTRQQPHPLSQALSPTSPTPAFTELDMRQTVVFQSPEAPRINFAKSLPVGALRPGVTETRVALNDTVGQHGSFGTPDAFRMARPDPAGFRSTGLISKRHRDPEDMPPPPGKAMPDTPCKKIPTSFGFSPSPTENRTIAQPRFAPPDFDTPSRQPLGQTKDATPAFPSSQTGSFANSLLNTRVGRRDSFVSTEGDETCVRSLPERGESHSSADELPPTPTKQAGSHSKPSSLRSSLFGRRPSLGPSTFATPSLDDKAGGTPDSIFQRSTLSSHLMPHTPQEVTTQVPDASGLSISPTTKQPKSPVFSSSFGSSVSRPPETPTSHRGLGDTTSFLGTHHLMMTPSNAAARHDADPVLFARFKKVEWYGRGEFSEVYKVYQSAASTQSYFSPATGGLGGSFASATPLPDAVFVVKRSKAPFGSAKLRAKKMREASIMKALGRDDHIVNFVNSWEANNHLYIQTDFCEEGSLASFLEKQGRRGRLDDFRIWKILIELSMGVKHIHDSGFIHLDLKPANVFIDFSGTLKIGDFGLACEWPAPEDIEGEGDRRYIGPDLLQGTFDKPADIFALGMIMFEIASNVDLPDNGESWQQLRSGDWSGLPSLTSGSTNSIFHSPDGMATSGSLEMDGNGPHEEDADIMDHSWRDVSTSSPKGPLIALDDLAQPPSFMIDPQDEGSLDRIVQWMMLPSPQQRPVIDQVLNANGCQWVQERRRSGATVFEGQWGPPPHVLREPDDPDMMDVS